MEGRNGKSQWRLPDHVPERVNRFVGFVGLQDGVADAICVGTSTTSGESLEMLNGVGNPPFGLITSDQDEHAHRKFMAKGTCILFSLFIFLVFNRVFQNFIA